MQNTHLINSNKLYILSAPSASGKSTLIKELISQGLPKEAVISTDEIRKQILGSSYSFDENGLKEGLNGWYINEPKIFNIINDIINIRLKQKLPVIIDGTNLTEKSREEYINFANTYGVEAEVIIFNFDKDELIKRLSKRQERFDLDSLYRQLDKFENTSKFSHKIINQGDKFILLPNLINTSKLDVVGDTHGLLDETILLLAKNNWKFENETFIHSDPERKVLFLGDIVDRGTQSIELLRAVMNTVNNGQGFFILGNHEAKLLSSVEQYINTKLVRGKSLSSSQTLMKFLNLSQEEQNKIYNFLLYSPIHLSLWIDKDTKKAVFNKPDNDNFFKIAFGHADNEYYNPYDFTRSYALYGDKSKQNKDLDLVYENGYLNNINKYVYIRGHVENHSLQNNVYSLEDNQAFAGNLVLLNVEKYINTLASNDWKSTNNFFKENIMKQKSEFNFNDEIKSNLDLLKKMTELVANGLATDGWRRNADNVKQAHIDGLKVFKYSKKVHFKRLWQTEPLLAKARGLVLDISGNVVVHPFDKLYNYGEYDTGMNVKPEQKVQMIEKLNGFLGCISKHPFRNELLPTTTGSLESPFVDYIKSFITPEVESKLLDYFKNNKVSLMFEVIHPEDEHIIKYDPKDHGLWLIGARPLDINAEILTETELDKLAITLNLKRAAWQEVSFQEVLDALPSSELEGYMVRDALTQEPLMKIKTNYYLVTKFVGRMGPKMTASMYKNPERFKENHMDEEFYPIVDDIVKLSPQSDFEAMEQKERVSFVRTIIDNQRNEVKNINKIKP